MPGFLLGDFAFITFPDPHNKLGKKMLVSFTNDKRDLVPFSNLCKVTQKKKRTTPEV